MKNENKEDLFLKLIKAKTIKLNDIINLVRTSIMDYDKLDTSGYNLLHYTIKSENPEIVNLLLSSDYSANPANPNIPTQDNHNGISLSPMHLALLTCNDGSNAYKILKALHKAGGDISAKDEDDCTIYHRSCEKGRTDILNYIFSLDTPQDVNETCKFGSAMHMALLGDQDDVISYLLEKKIDLCIKDPSGNTAMHLAIQLKQFNSFKLISDYIVLNRDIEDSTKKELYNAINEDGNTVLHELAFAKSSVLMDYLKKMDSTFKVDEELKNKQGYTYKGVQENLVKIAKEREEAERQKRELIRKEKEKILEERRKEEEAIRLEHIREIESEEKRKQIGLTVMKYRWTLLAIGFTLFMIMLYYFINSKAHRKREIII
jgi:ankyrin repeat protein